MTLKRYFSIGIIALYFCVGAFLLTREATHGVGSDAGQYNAGGINLVEKGIYSLDGITPFTEREPGQSVFLAAVYTVVGSGNYVAAMIAQAIIHLLAVSLLYVAIKKVYNEKVAALTSIFLLFTPSVYHIIYSLNRESLTLSLLISISALALMLKEKQRYSIAILLGMAMGYVCILYTPYILLPPFVAIVLLIWRVHIKHIVLIGLFCALIISPWAIRNHQVVGKMCITGCYRSALLWHVRGEQAEKIRGIEPLRCLWSEYISRNWTGRSEACSFNAVWHKQWPDGFTATEDDLRIGEAGKKKVLQYFPHYLSFSVFEILELHLPYVNGWGKIYNVLEALSRLVIYTGILLAIPAILRKLWKEHLLFLVIIGYTVGMFTLTDATPRYLMPSIFCYILFSAIGYANIGWIKKLLQKIV